MIGPLEASKLLSVKILAAPFCSFCKLINGSCVTAAPLGTATTEMGLHNICVQFFHRSNRQEVFCKFQNPMALETSEDII